MSIRSNVNQISLNGKSNDYCSAPVAYMMQRLQHSDF